MTSDRDDQRYDAFPARFFERSDETADDRFYAPIRLVTHIDDGAIDAVGRLYDELIPSGADVLDLMSSWVSHLRSPPARLTVLGMHAGELAANQMAAARVVHDLNTDPSLPFPDASFDAVLCCVSVDYLVRPIEVFDEAARVLRPGGTFVCTFSNRCFPTKAIAGWLRSSDEQHVEIVSRYFSLATGFDPPLTRRCPTPGGRDPLWAVWATRPQA